MAPILWDERIWATVVLQLRQRCKTFTEDVSLRLEQLLGLPPNNGKTQLVEMVVKAADVFRLCPNPNIRTKDCVQAFPDNVDPGHANWFAKTALNSYKIPGSYPWTHLDYPYDWNPASSEVGLSEYIIRKGAVVKVISSTPIADCCCS